jgi:hypothetical protein
MVTPIISTQNDTIMITIANATDATLLTRGLRALHATPSRRCSRESIHG